MGLGLGKGGHSPFYILQLPINRPMAALLVVVVVLVLVLITSTARSRAHSGYDEAHSDFEIFFLSWMVSKKKFMRSVSLLKTGSVYVFYKL